MKTDVLIIGAGPGGTATAMFLAQQGIDSVLVEKADFPRYHIGESMTGECTALLRELGLEARMRAGKYPIKKGVTVYGASGHNPWFVPVMGRDSNWQLAEGFTWQVRRSEFDRMMLEAALERGAEVLGGQAVEPILVDGGAVGGALIRMPGGQHRKVEAKIVVDASGQSTFLANAGVTGPKYRGSYDKQIAIFAQVSGALRGDDPGRNDTLIFYRKKYHWAWFIPLDEDTVSVGVVVPAAYFKDMQESKGDFLIRELRELNPELARRVPEVELVEETRAIVNYSYQVKDFAGPGFICIGDAHRFVDPIFSFGLLVTMKEAKLAAEAITDQLHGPESDPENPFAAFKLKCEHGLDVLEDAVDAFWEFPLAFARMVHVRHVELMIDLLAGRAYDHQPSEVVEAMRQLLGRARNYDDDSLMSVPIGSRYHPERAAGWEINATA